MDNDNPHFPWIGDPRKTMVWQIQKQRWIWGPDIPIYDPELENITQATLLPPLGLPPPPPPPPGSTSTFIHQGSTGLSLGQNLGVIFFFSQVSSNEGCMVAMAFDFSIQRWIKINKCIYRLDNVPIQAISTGWPKKSGILLRSASYFNKNAEL